MGIESEVIVRSMANASWLPPGGLAEVVISDTVPWPVALVRLLLRREGEVFCVPRAETGDLDLPTRRVLAGDEGGKASAARLARETLGVAVVPVQVGFVRNVVERPAAGYAWPIPLAHFTVWAADGEPAINGTWVDAATARSPLAQRHWFPLLAGLH